MGWSDWIPVGVFFGVTCNKPMRVPSPIPFKNIYFDSALAVSPETDAWPHEFQTSNGSVYVQIIWPDSHME